MNKKKGHKLPKIFSFLLILIMTMLLSMGNFMSVQASSEELDTSLDKGSQWVDRDASGIYEGDIGQYIKSDDSDPDGDEDEGLAAGDGWYGNIFSVVIEFICSQLANALYEILNLLGASFDNLIYGRLVSDKALFTFGLENGNIYGIVSGLMYNIIRGVAILGCMMLFMGKIAMSTWKRGQYAMIGLKDAFASFLAGVLLVIMMPYLLDVGLFLRDCILYVMSSKAGTVLFGNSSISIVGTLRGAAKQSILNSIMYLASVVLNMSFMMSYVGVALAMVIDFILFPFVVIKAFLGDRQVLSGWLWEMVSCALVPVIDAVLIMIPVFVGVYASYLGLSEEKVAVAILQVLICWGILPAREAARHVLGLQTSPLERAGYGASMFVGAMAMRGLSGIKNDFAEGRNDRRNADIEDKLADLDAETALNDEQNDRNTLANAFAQTSVTGGQEDMENKDKLPSYDDQQIGDENGFAAKRPEDFQNYDDETPLGQQQNYGDNVAAFQKANGEYDDQIADMDKQIGDLQEKEDDLQQKLNDPQISDADKANATEQLKELQAEEKVLLDKKSSLENLHGQDFKDAEKELKDVDAELGEIQQRKAGIKEKLVSDPDGYSFEQYESDMRQADADEKVLLDKKRRLEARVSQGMLKQEPSTLKNELADATSKEEQLIEKRQGLVRERNALQAEQDTLTGDSEKYKECGKNIAAKNEEIRQLDAQIGECAGKKKSASNALRIQQNELRDRQAYNLGERAKAQEAYDKEAAKLERYRDKESGSDPSKNKIGTKMRGNAIRRQEEKLEAAKQRLAAISLEDARINEKLQEYDPKQNQYTLKDLQKAKGEQQIRKAEAQSKIAMLNAEIGSLDPSNNDQKAQIEEKRRQIVKLTAESADANLQSARFDQMISGMRESGGYGKADGGSSYRGRTSSISSEYDQKRRAIMERYATIDNFEQPQFADISRERRAQLLRQRALRRNAAGVGKIAGATLGAVSSLYFGPSGMAVGGMVGAATGSAVFTGVGGQVGKVMYPVKTVNYKGKPLNVNVVSDLHGTSAKEQEAIIRVVGQNYENALSSGIYAKEFEDTFANKSQVMKDSRARLLKAKKITGPESYKQHLPELRRMAKEQLDSDIRIKEMEIVERCAGSQYVNLSEASKRRIADGIRRKSADLHISKTITQTVADIIPDTWENSFLDEKGKG